MRVRITEQEGREIDLDMDLGYCYLKNDRGTDATIEREGEQWTPFEGSTELLELCEGLLQKLKSSN